MEYWIEKKWYKHQPEPIIEARGTYYSPQLSYPN